MLQDASFLKDIILLQSMDDAERSAIAELMEDVHFSAGDVLFREDDQGGVCYVLKHGWVELSVVDDVDQKLVVDILGPGELFGELSLLDGGLRTATAVALSDVEAVSLRRPELIEFLRNKPDASLAIVSALTKRLRRADALLKQRVQDPNKIIEEKVTWGDWLADLVAAFGGSWRFIMLFGAAMGGWMLVNAFSAEPFDPFPFILLNLMLSTLAALQAPVIMMSQNRQDAKDRIRAEADYRVNVQAAAGITELHEKLDRVRVEMNLKIETLARRLPRN